MILVYNIAIQINDLNEIEIIFQIRTSEFYVLIKYTFGTTQNDFAPQQGALISVDDRYVYMFNGESS